MSAFRLDPHSPDCPLVQVIEREYYIRDLDTGKIGPIQLRPHQRAILNAVFTFVDGTPPWTTVVWSCIKKSGKTEIGAAVAYAFARLYGGEIYSIANDKEQAEGRMFDRMEQALEKLRDKKPKLFVQVVADEHIDRIVRNGVIHFAGTHQINGGPHRLKPIPTDYAGEAGATNALCVFDELWGYKGEGEMRLWSEMQPIPTLQVSMRFVTTYAGFYGESELLYSLYSLVVNPDPHTEEPRGTRIPGLEHLPCYQRGKTFVYWDHEGRMDWHTPEFLQEAKDDPTVQGRVSEYLRLWENRWSTGLEAFIDMPLVDRAMGLGDEAGLVNHMEGW